MVVIVVWFVLFVFKLCLVKVIVCEMLYDDGWVVVLQCYIVDVVLVVLGLEDGYCLLMVCIVVIGVLIGGLQVLEWVFKFLIGCCLGIVVVQYMLQCFMCSFVECLYCIFGVEVKEVEYYDLVLLGCVLIVFGGWYLVLWCDGQQYYVEMLDGLLVSWYKLLVDVLFCLVVKVVGSNVVGIIMIGMGDDGVRGMWEMVDCGVVIYVQDEVSSVVFGMLKEVIYMGGVGDVFLFDYIFVVIE